ncbi:MAG: hypothetical protein KGJ84_14570 [Elusimicrobia bacterium]|nr:hypothetical protein [Elusimicrobiota bacterium]
MRFLLALALGALLAAPCRANGEGDEDDAVPGMQPTSGLVLFYRSAGPMSFVAMTPKDVPEGARKIREVRGRACQRGLAVPIAANFNATNISAYLGDGSYGKALAQIKREHPDVNGIYDVRTDVEVFSVLGIYRSLCTIVTARAFALP